MPELPEVETIANGVHERVHGDWIDSVWLGSKPEPLKSPPELIAQTLAGSRIEQVHRVGKTIVFDLLKPASDSGLRSGSRSLPPALSAQFLVHLGMTGRLLVSHADVPVPPHTHWIGRLRSGRELRFVDARRFGRLSVVLPSDRLAHPSAGLAGTSDSAGDGERGYQGTGKEPLTISPEDFAALFHPRKTPIKAALLNQTLLHGVGNIYADEALFRAGIRPLRRASSLTRAELARLHSSLQEVLRHAISLGGSSVSDYVDADGVRGFFQLEHRVYMRTGQPCLVCGRPIKRIVLTGRGTHYCTGCQH
ncbi:MAG: bifunctional DNA-formamidopyrimidine glycosylase/DNA-(apurinic or apyrimidinic site) lyase [Acidobacteriaceae bacterium]